MQIIVQTLTKPNFNSKIIIKHPLNMFPITKSILILIDLSLYNMYNITQHKNLQAKRSQPFGHHYSSLTKILINFLLPFLSITHPNNNRSNHFKARSTRFNHHYEHKLASNHSNHNFWLLIHSKV